MDPTDLTDDFKRTYQELVGNSPTPRVPWSDVRALLESLAELTVEPSGNLTVSRHGRIVLTLHPALTKNIAESGEVKALRRFLQDSDTPPVAAAGRDPHLLLVIHGPAAARLYRCQVIGGVPQLILPYEESVPNPEDRTVRKVARGAKALKADGCYASMAEELQPAGQIVIFDTGSGREATTFVTWLSQHDRGLSDRVIGTVHLADQPLDHAGLLAAARRFYATLSAGRALAAHECGDTGVAAAAPAANSLRSL